MNKYMYRKKTTNKKRMYPHQTQHQILIEFQMNYVNCREHEQYYPIWSGEKHMYDPI